MRLPNSLSLVELPWFSPIPLTLTSSLRYLAVLLPYLSDSTQVLIRKHHGCSLIIMVVSTDAKVIASSYGRKFQGVGFDFAWIAKSRWRKG